MPNANIYNSPDRPLYTTATLTVDYQETMENVLADVTNAYSLVRDVSGFRVYSYAIINYGVGTAFVALQISPDGLSFMIDGIEQTVPASGAIVLTPVFFLQYMRLAYRATAASPLAIAWQAQT